jgi:sec-independent protein translocase protein TatA
MFEGLFQPMHLLLIFGIALLVFGPKKLPELGKGIGEGIRGFKAAMQAEEQAPGGLECRSPFVFFHDLDRCASPTCDGTMHSAGISGNVCRFSGEEQRIFHRLA